MTTLIKSTVCAALAACAGIVAHAAVPTADLMDLHFNQSSVTDASDMFNEATYDNGKHKPRLLGAHKDTKYIQHSFYGIGRAETATPRKFGHFSNTWGAEGSDVNAYARIDYKGNTAFINGLKNGHSIECTFRINNYNTVDWTVTQPHAFKIFSSHEEGGTGIEIDTEGHVQFSIYTDGGYHSVNGMKLQEDRLYQVIGIYDHTNQKISIYVNGKKRGEKSAPGNLTMPKSNSTTDSKASYWFGVAAEPALTPDKPQMATNVYMHKARIFDKVLTDAEALALWEDMVKPPYTQTETIAAVTQHDNETTPSQLMRLAVNYSWTQPTGMPKYHTDMTAEGTTYTMYTVAKNAINVTYNNGSAQTYTKSPTAAGSITYNGTSQSKPLLKAGQPVTVTVQPTFHVKYFPDGATDTEGALVNGNVATKTVTPDYSASVGTLTAKGFKDRTAGHWRVDLNFDRAALATYPEPVSYFTLQYHKAGETTWQTIPGLRIMRGGKVYYHSAAEAQAFNSTLVHDGKVAGSYRFGNESSNPKNVALSAGVDKGYALAIHDNEPVVAWHEMDYDPTGNVYRVTAAYAPSNSLIGKNATAQSAPVGGEFTVTGIDDLEASADDAPTLYYDLQGHRIAQPQPGAVVIELQNGKARKVKIRD